MNTKAVNKNSDEQMRSDQFFNDPSNYDSFTTK